MTGVVNTDRHRIALAPMGDIPDLVPRVIAAHVSAFLHIDTVILKTLQEPVYAMDPRRCQFNAAPILQRLESRGPGPMVKVVGVLNVDLFVPVFSHVFGQARQGGRAALVSLYRLGPEAPGALEPSALVLERAAKIALHEICHLFSLTHCQDRRCLMHFSGNLAELDRLRMGFCRYCTQYIREAT